MKMTLEIKSLGPTDRGAHLEPMQFAVGTFDGPDGTGPVRVVFSRTNWSGGICDDCSGEYVPSDAKSLELFEVVGIRQEQTDAERAQTLSTPYLQMILAAGEWFPPERAAAREELRRRGAL